MKCKHSSNNCAVHVITEAWEEKRGCDYGAFCNYNKNITLSEIIERNK